MCESVSLGALLLLLFSGVGVGILLLAIRSKPRLEVEPEVKPWYLPDLRVDRYKKPPPTPAPSSGKAYTA